MSLGDTIRSGSLRRFATARGAWSIAPYAGAAYTRLADLGVEVYGAAGLGLPPLALVLVGAVQQDTRILAREIVLRCVGSDAPAAAQSLYALLAPDRPGALSTTPALLRYEGAARTIEIGVVLASEIMADSQHGLVLRLRSSAPYWSAPADDDGNLSTSVSLLSSFPISGYVLLRTAAGVWSAPAGGPASWLFALHYGALSGNLYAGTDDGAVWRWDGAAWVQLGAALGAEVRALLEGPDGMLYAAGSFAGYVKRWDGAAWVTLPGLGGSVFSLALGPDAQLYAGLDDLGYVKSWDGAAWSTVGSGLTAVPTVLLLGPDNRLYACGHAYVRRLDAGAIWSPIAGVGEWDIAAGLFQPDGRLIVGGDLIGYAQAWNGSGWVSLDLADQVRALLYSARGLHIFGDFSTAGGLSLWSSCAIRRGGTFFSFEVKLGADRWFAQAVGLVGGGMALGLAGTGSSTAYTAGHASVAIGGTAPAYPVLTCTYETANVAAPLYYIVNLTTGEEIHFDGLNVLKGETITIDCEAVNVTSDYRGDLSSTVRAGSRPLRLLPGVENALLFNGDAQIDATLSAVVRYATLQAAEA